MKTDIIYSDDTLFVYFEGTINKKELKSLKKKIYNIVDEYQINDIVFDLEKVISYDNNLDLFIKEYNHIYDNNIKIIK